MLLVLFGEAFLTHLPSWNRRLLDMGKSNPLSSRGSVCLGAIPTYAQQVPPCSMNPSRTQVGRLRPRSPPTLARVEARPTTQLIIATYTRELPGTDPIPARHQPVSFP
jgi:hypothetical protein